MGWQGMQFKDVFQEIGNVGTGSCMASLSHMIGEEVRYSPPQLIELEYGSLSEWFGNAGESVVGVLVPFDGDIRGMILHIYRNGMVRSILEGVLGEHSGEGELDGQRLDLLREVGSIAASTYLTSLALYTDCRLALSSAAVSMDMAGAIVTELIGAAGLSEETLCIGNHFQAKGREEASHMLVIMQAQSARKFVEALEVSE